jgi:probable HAF family extracellular repeat protein
VNDSFINWHAFLKNPGQAMQDLGTLGGSVSEAWRINDIGQIIGDSGTTYGYINGFLINPGEAMQDLGPLIGNRSEAWGINNNGQIIGQAFTATGLQHAFLINPGEAMQDLGTLGGGRSEAWGINNNGRVVGNSSINSLGESHAFIWTKSGGMKDLNTLVTNIPDGVYLLDATAINDAGQIVGQASNQRSFILTPIP